jgi:hypothetical protein
MTPPRYLIRDQDRVEGTAVPRRLRRMGVGGKPIAPRFLWQNGGAESLIGSVRRATISSCLVRLICVVSSSLMRIRRSHAQPHRM